MVQATKSAEAAEGEHGVSLLDEVSELRARVRQILDEAQASKSFMTAIAAAREISRLIELRAKLLGQIDASATINIAFAPELLLLQQAVMTALAPFDDAKRAVVAALTRLSGSGSAPLTIADDPG